jgi:hypothetical protein
MRRVLRRASSDYHAVNTYLVALDSLAAQRTPRLPVSEIWKVNSLLVASVLIYALSDVFFFHFPTVTTLIFAATYLAIHLVLSRVIGWRPVIPAIIINGLLLIAAVLI